MKVCFCARQECGLIQLLEPFLAAGQAAPVIAQALEGLGNLTRFSRTRQEAAAVSGIVPHLLRLVASQVRPQPAHVASAARAYPGRCPCITPPRCDDLLVIGGPILWHQL